MLQTLIFSQDGAGIDWGFLIHITCTLFIYRGLEYKEQTEIEYY